MKNLIDELPPYGSGPRAFKLKKPFTKFDSFFNAKLHKDPKTRFLSYHTKNELTVLVVGVTSVLFFIFSD
jgi:hypothetical protein